jgi:hypothetical protein
LLPACSRVARPKVLQFAHFWGLPPHCFYRNTFPKNILRPNCIC